MVCYWDGFGIGSDEDPRRLSERIAAWLGPAGKALIEIGTPWYAAPFDGCGWAVGEAERQYSFDADGCRWEDRWRLKGRPEEAVKQSTRCYSPADLRLLAAGTGLAVTPCQAGRRHGLGRAKVAARCAAQAVDEIRCPVVSCEVAE